MHNERRNLWVRRSSAGTRSGDIEARVGLDGSPGDDLRRLPCQPEAERHDLERVGARRNAVEAKGAARSVTVRRSSSRIVTRAPGIGSPDSVDTGLRALKVEPTRESWRG